LNKSISIIPEVIKLRRKELNLTQEEIAKQIGVGRSQYANIEVGNCYPSIVVLYKMVKVLGISFEEMFGLVPSKRVIEAKQKRLQELKDKVSEIENEISELKNVNQ
jgi:transcriptional regulator with XRE-family HTH domain